jgi:hypothetical protein
MKFNDDSENENYDAALFGEGLKDKCRYCE